ncbi:class I SAM-dependent methyltransferase [Dactylosporangium sp. NPDC051541]|uniref:class I SAM-dependent methyltransferase n=1 Tax=Dactylosporangium sp. NPDC051541 TaxID=3363977 RepID=UPI0037A75F75
MDSVTRRNREIWEAASRKHVSEYDELLDEARSRSPFFPAEAELLAPLLEDGPVVVHLQSGHGLDDVAMIRGGARRVIGVDFSATAATAAQRRADELGVACSYVVGLLPGAPLADSCADVLYTGKGALIWQPDIAGWARDAARLLRPGGHLFVYEEHPAHPLWTWDLDEPRIRGDRSYFGRTYVSDTFPGAGAALWLWTLGEIVTAVVEAGLTVRHLSEHAEPFWRFDGLDAAAFRGRLPNTFALLATK